MSSSHCAPAGLIRSPTTPLMKQRAEVSSCLCRCSLEFWGPESCESCWRTKTRSVWSSGAARRWVLLPTVTYIIWLLLLLLLPLSKQISLWIFLNHMCSPPGSAAAEGCREDAALKSKTGKSQSFSKTPIQRCEAAARDEVQGTGQTEEHHPGQAGAAWWVLKHISFDSSGCFNSISICSFCSAAEKHSVHGAQWCLLRRINHVEEECEVRVHLPAFTVPLLQSISLVDWGK